jgi:hypothetical protein
MRWFDCLSMQVVMSLKSSKMAYFFLIKSSWETGSEQSSNFRHSMEYEISCSN